MGATFALTESVVANQRHTDDAVNGAAGACAAGFLAGLRGKYEQLERQVFPQICCQRVRFPWLLALALYLVQQWELTITPDNLLARKEKHEKKNGNDSLSNL
jgi:hypothetical protein